MLDQRGEQYGYQREDLRDSQRQNRQYGGFCDDAYDNQHNAASFGTYAPASVHFSESYTRGSRPYRRAVGSSYRDTSYGHASEHSRPQAVSSHQTSPQQTRDAVAFRTDRSLTKTRRAPQPQGGPRWVTYTKRALLAMLVVVLLFFGTVGAYAAWYMVKLDGELDLDEATRKSIANVLTPRNGDDPFYILLLGSDSREGSATSDDPANTGDNERSDVMMLIRIDAPNKLVTIVSIPRDTPIIYPDGSIGKINEAYNIGGAEYSLQVVKELTGVDISHYVEIHLSEFEKMIDSLGGIEIDVPIQMSYENTLTGEIITLQPGLQTLNGSQAQIFVRARHEFGEDQDARRQSNNRMLLEAIINKVLSKRLLELPGVILTIAGCVKTDIEPSELISLARTFITAKGKMTIYGGTGPSRGDINKNAGGLWLCYENPEGWAKLMDAVNAGDDPNLVDVESTAILH